MQPAQHRPFPTCNILGVEVAAVSLQILIDFMIQSMRAGERRIVANVNAHALNLAFTDSFFRGFLNRADIVFCDGFGVKWAARLLGQRLPERFTPPDFLLSLARDCAANDLSVFLLGARPGIGDRAAEQMRRAAPTLRVATHHGYFDKEARSPENRRVVEEILHFDPDLLVVGFGMPLQERWLEGNWPSLRARTALPVGAAIDYLAGEVARAPRWMTDHGFEWLGRLLIEPRRLWRRYVVGNPLFVARVLAQRLGRRPGL